ncbi:camp-dependent protein kinase regulatory subunit [Linderina pennispora]|uniref:cAMP-dependent protein kinase regulatory subunit n=1 Tax=Linderina pennispora TaxID=61395 RepID=A0A1Y1W6M1_9FUNG|nr:camp-dependent protein kinase regulatory subunit [Linderina pennispora]ORX69025.1 camp-dependent protein kinase regulatory subunit [Linderina pennispora]
MDSEKTTLSENHAEYEAEIIEVLGELREAVFRRQPSDIYQFCATYFNEKLAEQREGLLELASSHAWSEGVPAEAANGLLNPDFSFGAAMEEDETDEARDKFSRLVHLPPNSAVQPFAGRRFSVSAESMNPTTEAEFERKFVPKTESQKQRIRQALSNNFLFKNLDEDAYRDVVDAMEEKQVAAGQDIITQGGVGDFFYIVERGSFDIFVTKGDEPPSKVATAGDGGSFGELALMYNAPRAATVHATTAATLWALDRITFRRLLMERTSRKRRLYERFLETVPLLKSLEPYERQKIADALESITFNDGDVVVRQGDKGDAFYLIEQGTVRVIKADQDGVEREYPSLDQGGYFGELALLDDQPRQATLVAQGRTKCARMSKDAFDRLLGPVINIIRREAGNYTRIQSLGQAHLDH